MTIITSTLAIIKAKNPNNYSILTGFLSEVNVLLPDVLPSKSSVSHEIHTYKFHLKPQDGRIVHRV